MPSRRLNTTLGWLDRLVTDTGCTPRRFSLRGWSHVHGTPRAQHLKFAIGVGVVLAALFLIAALVEPFVGELETQTILVPANPLGAMILAIAAAFGF